MIKRTNYKRGSQNKKDKSLNKNIDEKIKKRNKPDADLANVAYELSSKGRNTNLTTKLPETRLLVCLNTSQINNG